MRYELKKTLIIILLFIGLIFANISGCKKSTGLDTKDNPSKFYSVDQSACKACGKCYDVCPHNAIVYSGRKAIIIQSKCKKCGECMKICPTDAIH